MTPAELAQHYILSFIKASGKSGARLVDIVDKYREARAIINDFFQVDIPDKEKEATSLYLVYLNTGGYIGGDLYRGNKTEFEHWNSRVRLTKKGLARIKEERRKQRFLLELGSELERLVA